MLRFTQNGQFRVRPNALCPRHVAAGVALFLVHCTGGAARAASRRVPGSPLRRRVAAAARCRCAGSGTFMAQINHRKTNPINFPKIKTVRESKKGKDVHLGHCAQNRNLVPRQSFGGLSPPKIASLLHKLSRKTLNTLMNWYTQCQNTVGTPRCLVDAQFCTRQRLYPVSPGLRAQQAEHAISMSRIEPSVSLGEP